jgi:hypothetical protein
MPSYLHNLVIAIVNVLLPCPVSLPISLKLTRNFSDNDRVVILSMAFECFPEVFNYLQLVTNC